MTGVERGRFERQARAVGAGLQYRAPAVSHPATEDGRYAPARDWRAELELPLLFKSGEHARQLVEPRLHFAAEAGRETLPCSQVDAGNGALEAHVGMRYRRCTTPFPNRRSSRNSRWPRLPLGSAGLPPPMITGQTKSRHSSTSPALKACAARCAPPTVRSLVAEAFMSRTDAGSKRCSSRVLAVCTAA